MYADILRQISLLKHGELIQLRAQLTAEIKYRESLDPIAWQCVSCDFSAPSWAEVINHAQKKHNLEQIGAGYGIYPPRAVYA